MSIATEVVCDQCWRVFDLTDGDPDVTLNGPCPEGTKPGVYILNDITPEGNDACNSDKDCPGGTLRPRLTLTWRASGSDERNEA